MWWLLQRLLQEDGAVVQLEPVQSRAGGAAFLVRDHRCEWEDGLEQSKTVTDARGLLPPTNSNSTSRQHSNQSGASVSSRENMNLDDLMDDLCVEREKVEELEEQLQSYEVCSCPP